jgi:hypothetical protein
MTMRLDIPSFLSRFRKTDEEHVEGVRRMVLTFDRWRKPFIALYVLMSIGLVAGMVALLVRLHQFGQNLNGISVGLVFGIILGAWMGVTIHNIGSALSLFLLGYRNERLLIHYFDASQESLEEDADDEEFPDPGDN